MTTNLVMAGTTDRGMVRDHNEDSIFFDPGIGIAVLADGMGGHLAGEVASGMAVDIIAAHLVNTPSLPGGRKQDRKNSRLKEAEALRRAVASANAEIYNLSRERPECAGMGTTVVVAVFHGRRLSIGHIGDSRLYRYRGGKLAPMTVDHSAVQELVNRGVMSEEEARTSIHKNIVTRALGIDSSTGPDINELVVRDKDIYLLCSDGLNDVLTDADIRDLMAKSRGNLDRMASTLVETANSRGGPDNISVILAKAKGSFRRSRKAIRKFTPRTSEAVAGSSDETIDLD